MAVIQQNGIIRGSAGPMTFRRYRNLNIMQGRKTKHRFTEKSIVSYTEFGLISSASACIRQVMEPAYRFSDGRIGGRVVSAVSKCVRSQQGTQAGTRDLHDGDLQHLRGLEFNTSSPLSDTLQLSPSVVRQADGELRIELPALDMSKAFKRPKFLGSSILKVKLRFLLAAFNFKEQYYEYVDRQEVDYPVSGVCEGRTLVMKGDFPPGCVHVLSMSLSLYGWNELDGGEMLLNCKSFSPCAVIDAWHTSASAAPAKTAEHARKRTRHSMSYQGNALLAALPERIRNHRNKAYAGPAAASAFKKRRSGQSPPGKAGEEQDIVFGKKMRF